MKELMSHLPEVMLVLFILAVFVIVFVTVLKTLKRTVLFDGKIAALISIAVSVLCVVGLMEFLVIPGRAYRGRDGDAQVDVTLRYILLPYVALALAIVLSQLVILASRMLPGAKSEATAEESKRSPVKHKFPGRPKKEQPGRQTVPPRPAGGKEKNEAKVKTTAEVAREK